MEKRTLGICIPTYNRCSRLLSLIDELLLCDDEDFIILVTDNCSTDNSSIELKRYDTNRVLVLKNENTVPGFYNILKCVFNCNCKYALLCNDRDIIDHKKLYETIAFLRSNNISFARILDYNEKESNGFFLYERGTESLDAIKFTFHPTGTIYNLECMRKNGIIMDDYLSWEGTEKYCKLAWDLAWLGETAIIKNNLWRFAEMEYYSVNASGYSAKRIHKTDIYYHPLERMRNMTLILDYLLTGCRFSSFDSDSSRGQLAKSILNNFFDNVMYYKYSASSFYENAHYGLKRRFVTTIEMLKWCVRFNKQSLMLLQNNGIPDEELATWKKGRISRIVRTVKTSIVFDLVFLKRIVSREKW